jgi:small conductance mechanosensitive channel
VVALCILIAGIMVANWAHRTLRRFLSGASHIDPTVKSFLAAVVRYSVLVLVGIAALSQLGVQTTSLLAVLGAAGLAIGLALQGTLSNIAAGLMLLWLRPFRLGDYVEVPIVPGLSGRIRDIGLFACQLETFDGLYLFVPNSSLWNTALRNHSRSPGRIVSANVTIAAKADSGRACQAVHQMLAEDARILKTPEPKVFTESFSGGNVTLGLVFWTTPLGAGPMQRGIVEQLRSTLQRLGSEFAPISVVRTVPPDSDPSRLMATQQDSS